MQAANQPQCNATEAAVRAALDRLAPTGAVGIAVSGGGDSVALLVIAARWAAAGGRRIAAATVDHGLRPDSAVEAAAVAALCARLGVRHATLAARDLKAGRGNLSARARDARYGLLAGWAAGAGLAAVALGHTLDDQAETVLMRLARGSGVEGLAAMAPVVERLGLAWLRPLLEVRRDALRALLAAEGAGWVEDPTNEAPEYDRVKARRALAALAPLGLDAEGLAETARQMQRQRRVLDRAMADLAGHARLWGEFGEARLRLAPMRADAQDTALRLLADTLCRVSGRFYRPRFRALTALWARLGTGRGASLHGCLLRPVPGDGLLVCREPAAVAAPVPASDGAVWDNRWRLSAATVLPPGARFGALGPAGLAALKAAAAEGRWQAPAPWAAAPRPVRLAAPALWLDSAADGPVLLAAPPAGYAAPGGAGPPGGIAAESLGARELHSRAGPDYVPPRRFDATP